MDLIILGAGYGTNDMLWSENDGFQLKVNGATGIIGNIDPYDKNSQYYNYRDKTRKAKKQYNYRTGYKNVRILDTRQILANNYINFFSDTKYPINAYPEIIEDWSEQVAERGDQWLGYRSDTLKHANNLLMVYDYQKFMDSPFFERTDIGLENYGAYNRDYTKSAEFTPFPSPWNMSRRDGSGLITGMLVPPVFYVLGSMIIRIMKLKHYGVVENFQHLLITKLLILLSLSVTLIWLKIWFIVIVDSLTIMI